MRDDVPLRDDEDFKECLHQAKIAWGATLNKYVAERLAKSVACFIHRKGYRSSVEEVLVRFTANRNAYEAFLHSYFNERGGK